MTKRNAADSTLRNVRAANKRLAKIEKRLRDVEKLAHEVDELCRVLASAAVVMVPVAKRTRRRPAGRR